MHVALTENTKAPLFSGTSLNGPVSLEEYYKKYNVVLYFYPKDNTPGCTLESKGFTKLVPEFERLKTKVIGVSKDSLDSHQSFCDQYNLSVNLISDTDLVICKDYKVWVEKSFLGKKYMGIERSTFLINKEQIIVKVWHKAKVIGHASEVLETVRNLDTQLF